ncbi:MAG: N-acetyl-gamma-glutamyl-phosphate reductase, partial [Leptospiraceae bacterium]|nr:N-acetyl-gamma-glutamyl-phosphate reductase [Leptospiraceae bacterium]
KELISLLTHHPNIEISHITSNKTPGLKLSEVFPATRYKKDLVFKKHEDEIPKDSLVVLAVPNDVSLQITPKLLDKGYKLIDLSGAYRLHNREIFEKYYKLQHDSFSLMKDVVFGLPEIFRKQIQNSRFVSNPGCYSTSVILPLFFLGELRKKIHCPVVVDSKSGVSGAGGRTEDIGFTFTNTYENFRAYKIFHHQHFPEMEEYSRAGSDKQIKIIFTPHLLPIYRGILTTIVIQFEESVSKEEIEKELNQYRNEPFVRFYNSPEEIELKNVQNTNFLDIGFKVEENILILVSALDNLVKGAAGQALQNINLMFGFDERKGLIDFQ